MRFGGRRILRRSDVPPVLLGRMARPLDLASLASKVVVDPVAESEGEDEHLLVLLIDAIENSVFSHAKPIDPAVDWVFRADEHPATVAGRVSELVEGLDE